MVKIVLLPHNVLSAQYMFRIQVDIIKRFNRMGRVRVKIKVTESNDLVKYIGCGGVISNRCTGII